MAWTKEQDQAITLRGEDLLISAAAGSGKTAVLAERVVRFVEEGGDLGRLLIVTFTRSAAAEMRARIAKNLNEAALKRPDDRHLQRQSLTLYKATIGTIDSFGISLLRKNFAAANLSPDFGVMDQNEETILKDTVAKRLVEDAYAEFPEGFDAFLTVFGGETDDDFAQIAIKEVAQKAEHIPFADDWLTDLEKNLENVSLWTDAACALWLPVFRQCAEVFCAARDAGFYSTEKEVQGVSDDADYISSACRLLQEKDWDGACCKIRGWTTVKAPRAKKDSLPEIERYKTVRDLLKQTVNKQEMFFLSSEDRRSDFERLAPAVRFLLKQVRNFRARMLQEMERNDRYSFSVLSEKALCLTVSDYDRRSGSFSRTAIGEAERAAYDEILIDEYQDVNDIQDLLFRSVTQNNCFCVGDIKQSIYRFRGANSNNFLRRRSENRVVALNKNFRSRAGILDFVNFLCRGLFSLQVGGLKYDEAEQLNPGRQEEGANPFPVRYEEYMNEITEQDAPFPRFSEGNPAAEVFLLRDTTSLDGVQRSSAEAQALLCAKLIRDAVEGGATVYDKQSKTVRPMRYSDVAVLMRVSKSMAVYREIFRRSGVPLLAERTSFLTEPEVCGMTALLAALNNPRDDLNLFVALTGSAFRLSADRVAKIRIASGRGQPLYEGMEKAARSDPEIKTALTRLTRFRILAENLPVSRLIWEIYTATDYLALESVISPNARENLMKFYGFAHRYSGVENLTGFLNFVQRVGEGRGGEEDVPAPEGDFVHIETIHGSKGLEYPWCLIVQTEAKGDPNRGQIGIDPELGIGVDLKDPIEPVRYTTFPREVIKARNQAAETSEMLRVLYVALTRPRDRITVIGVPTKTALKKAASSTDADGNVYLSELYGTNDVLSLLLDRLARHPSAAVLHDDLIRPERAQAVPVQVAFLIPPAEEIRQERQVSDVCCGLSRETLEERFSFRYDAHLSVVPAKVSVTEISKTPPDPDSALLIESPPAVKPRFLDGNALTAAEAGTAMHAYCQYADLFASVPEQLERLKREGHLSEAGAAAINVKQIEQLQNSPLMKRLQSAAAYQREVRFVCRIPVSYFSGHPGEEGQMLMQGAIDLLIETDAGYEVVDFKTDRATEEQLKERYSRQVNLYVTAVEQLYDKPVIGASIWSFRLGKEIPIRRGDL